LYASNGKAVKLRHYLEEASIKYFFPFYYKDVKTGDAGNCEQIALPLIGNLIFAYSSKEILDPVLKEAKRKLAISSDLYYRDFGDKRMITIPENQMRNFIAIAENSRKNIIYLSNKDVSCRKGTRVKITGGEFAGVEGVFMRIKGNKRLVVNIPQLFSVATEYIPTCYVQTMENGK
ncbi:MAG: UpxY family transcription antiterminator, partial [Prevotellaceae bacterium]|nr:UpxY family transcription antiterminator [Prevotellaceae bacterium]